MSSEVHGQPYVPYADAQAIDVKSERRSQADPIM